MSVDVATGAALIAGSESATQGVYSLFNDATLNLTIGAADPSNGRIDRVVAKVQDTELSGATNAGSIVVVQGTASGSPSAPAAPANSITLALITVDAGATSITSAKISAQRTFLHYLRTGRISNSSNDSVATSSWETCQFATTDWDDDGLADLANDQLVIPSGGTDRYRFTVRAIWDSMANTATAKARLYLNTTAYEVDLSPGIPGVTGTKTPHLHGARTLSCTPGDTIKLQVWQDSGGPVYVTSAWLEYERLR